MKKLLELAVDETFEIFVLIKGAEVRLAKNGKKFIAFTFQDTTGTIDGKFWDASEEDIARFTPGKVVLLNGKREVYQGNPQVKIFKMREAKETEPYQVGQYIEKAPLEKSVMEEAFSQYLFKIERASWNRIVRFLLTKFHEEFFEFPAAKRLHHAFYGGLAYHTLTLLHLSESIVKEYEKTIPVNSSLLYAGCIIHDLGKVLELTGYTSTNYTLAGNLIGHLVLIDEEIIAACKELKIDSKDEDVILLRHMVLSHHGKREFGSPVVPQLLEAEILHQVDNLDASMQMMNNALKQTGPNEYSERVFGLDNRNFFRPEI